jgi:hypothetical protein
MTAPCWWSATTKPSCKPSASPAASRFDYLTGITELPTFISS